MANTAIATAGDVPKMAQAFKKAIEAGRESYLAGFCDVVEKVRERHQPLTGFYTINFERLTKMKERTNHMEYMEGMEVIDSTLLDEVISAMDAYDYDKYTDKDVENALSHDVLTTEDFAALLSPAALNHLEEMAQRAQIETRKHFGNSVSMFTPFVYSKLL